MSPETPVKRKRGRPPKAGSLSNQITTTMNINVNTSSFNNSPTAENNSNMMVKRGVPDISKPFMKVSPTPRSRKRSRREGSLSSSSSASLAGSPLQERINASNYQHHLQHQQYLHHQHQNGYTMTTPLSQLVTSSSFTPYNSRAIENIAMITQSNDSSFLPIYNTPPSSSVKNQFQTNYWATPPFAQQIVSHDVHALSTPTNSVTSDTKPPSSTKRKSVTTREPSSGTVSNSVNKLSPKSKGSKNLLPAASIRLNETSTEDSNDFILKLMIDDLGKAVLRDDIFGTRDEVPKKKKKMTNVQQPQQQQQPRLTHSNSVIGIESMTDSRQVQHPLRRHNSDFAVQVTPSVSSHSSSLSSVNEDIPQLLLPTTPKIKDNYLLSGPNGHTGLTPNASNLTYNLTPLFNATIYSMMSINSPLQKKFNPAQLFTSSQEFFSLQSQASAANGSCSGSTESEEDTINIADLMNMGSNTSLDAMANKQTFPIVSAMSTSASSSTSTSDPSTVSSTYQGVVGGISSPDQPHDDTSDARLALRKIIHVKRARN